MIVNNKEKRVFSIEKVGDEIDAGGDELATWASQRGSDFFLKPETPILEKLGDVSHWVTSQNYDPAAVNTFLQVADYYVIADALAHGYTVVTHEIMANTPKKIKIPNVYVGLGIKCMTPYEMLRHERARFILGSSPKI